MNNVKNRLYLTRGDTHFMEFKVRREYGNICKLEEGDVVYFTVKKSVYDESHILQKVIRDFDDGIAKFVIEPEDTKGLFFGEYVYDVQVVFADGVVNTVIKPAILTIGKEVTDE